MEGCQVRRQMVQKELRSGTQGERPTQWIKTAGRRVRASVAHDGAAYGGDDAVLDRAPIRLDAD